MKFSKKILKKKILGFFFSKSWNGGKFTKLRPEIESRNGGDHELWNHEIRGLPVLKIFKPRLFHIHAKSCHEIGNVHHLQSIYWPFAIFTSANCFFFFTTMFVSFYNMKQVGYFLTPTEHLFLLILHVFISFFWTIFGCWVYLGQVLLLQCSNQKIYITKRNHVRNW